MSHDLQRFLVSNLGAEAGKPLYLAVQLRDD